ILHHGAIGNRTTRPEGWVNTVDFSHDGRWLVSAGKIDVSFWSVPDGAELARLPSRNAMACFHPWRRELMISDSDGVQRQKFIGAINEKPHLESAVLLANNSRQSGTFCCWSHNGQWLAFRQAGKNSIVVQNAEDASKQYTLGPNPAVRYISLSANGRWLATAPWYGKSIRVWEVETGKITPEFPELLCDYGWVAFSPDGQWLVTSTEKGSRLWDTTTWQPGAWHLSEHANSFAFSRDSTILAIGLGRHAKLIDVASGI